LARIKKIMKSEEFVMQELEKDRCLREGIEPDDRNSVKFMISAEAPLVMSKACELLIRELSVRAWQHTSRNRRRTLQRQDIHAAVGESDVYDFLIDIIPRVATHRLPAPNAIPVEMTQMGPIVVQNFGIPTAHMNLNMPAALLQHQANAVGAPGQADLNAILEQQQHQIHQEQLMLAFPAQMSGLPAGLDNPNGQQQQPTNGAPQLSQQLLQQQQAIAAARAQQQSDQQASSQWSNP
jgi:histone H3/H4